MRAPWAYYIIVCVGAVCWSLCLQSLCMAQNPDCPPPVNGSVIEQDTTSWPGKRGTAQDSTALRTGSSARDTSAGGLAAGDSASKATSGQSTGTAPPPPPPPMPIFNMYDMGSVSFSFAQSASANWQQGEEDYFALKFALNSRKQISAGPVLLRTNIITALGANYKDDSIPENALRVGDNDMFGELVVVYPVRWIMDPYISGSFRTSITESFQYFFLPRTRVASLWDPVTSQQGAGFTYMVMGQSGMFNTRLGVSLQQIRARYQTQMSDDYMTPEIEQYKSQSGIEFVNEGTLRQDSTLTYTGRLSLFGSFQELGVWSVRWENETRFRLWKFFGLTWTFNVLHDIKQTRRTQFKQAIMLGILQDF